MQDKPTEFIESNLFLAAIDADSAFEVRKKLRIMRDEGRISKSEIGRIIGAASRLHWAGSDLLQKIDSES